MFSVLSRRDSPSFRVLFWIACFGPGGTLLGGESVYCPRSPKTDNNDGGDSVRSRQNRRGWLFSRNRSGSCSSSSYPVYVLLDVTHSYTHLLLQLEWDWSPWVTICHYSSAGTRAKHWLQKTCRGH